MYKIKPLEWKCTLKSTINNGTKTVEDWVAINSFMEYKVWAAVSGRYFYKASNLVSGEVVSSELKQQCKSLKHAKDMANKHWIIKIKKVLI